MKTQFISIFKIRNPSSSPINNNSVKKIHLNNIPIKTFLSQNSKITIKINQIVQKNNLHFIPKTSCANKNSPPISRSN